MVVVVVGVSARRPGRVYLGGGLVVVVVVLGGRCSLWLSRSLKEGVDGAAAFFFFSWLGDWGVEDLNREKGVRSFEVMLVGCSKHAGVVTPKAWWSQGSRSSMRAPANRRFGSLSVILSEDSPNETGEAVRVACPRDVVWSACLRTCIPACPYCSPAPPCLPFGSPAFAYLVFTAFSPSQEK